jgi:hypothetical protein
MEPVRLQGRVCAIRKFHKNLRFVDLMLTDDGKHVELVLRKEHAHMRVMRGDSLDVMGVYDAKFSKRMPEYNVCAVNKVECGSTETNSRWGQSFKQIVGLWPDENPGTIISPTAGSEADNTLNAIARSEGMAGEEATAMPAVLCRLWLSGRCPSGAKPCRYRHYCVSVEEHKRRDRLEHLR